MKTLREMMDLIESAQTLGISVGTRVFNRNEPDDSPASTVVGIVDTNRVRVKDGFSGDIVIWQIKDLVKAGRGMTEDQLEETEVDPVRRVEELFRNK